MSLKRFGDILLVLASAIFVPSVVYAQLGPAAVNPCCNVCGQQVCTCATTRPVIETRLRQQNCLTYQDRKRMACRTEPVCVTVPVQKVDCVTVDEGCYQMVWVPKPVTKAVPRTEYHQATSYRTVPYEICERVPVMTTRIVPEQTIRYVTEHRTVTTTAPVPLCPPPPCPPPAVCGPGGCAPGVGAGPFGIPSVVPGVGGRGGLLSTPWAGPPAGFGGPSPVAVPYSAMKDSGKGSGMATAGLVPPAQYAEQPAANWSPVTAKGGMVARPVSATMRRPTAAAVWQTQRP